MAPIVSIIGRSKSGKTTLLEKLIIELKSRGYRVGTMKHTPLGMAWIDDEKDSQRHIKAGSEATILCAPDKLVLVKPVTGPQTLEEIARLFNEDCDIILTEGFKQGEAPKIEVHRRGIGTPLKDVKKLFAIATDEKLDTTVKQFALNDIKGIANLLEEGFIKPQKERLLLYVNDDPIPLSSFPRDIITNILLGLANSLKGVGKIKTLKIFLQR
jgi:molybdopterin-guanine dinucleotide biosynthesis adapter protein